MNCPLRLYRCKVVLAIVFWMPSTETGVMWNVPKVKRSAYFLHDWGTSARALVNHLMAACLLLLIITHHVISPQNLPSSLHFPERVSELSSTWTYVKPS